ncbi:MAG: FMN reductase [Saprospiraceae bacterium]|nr:MAG: FMN reductase [Saprospiraceae bacterium]
MTPRKTIFAISGSTKKTSANLAILKAIASMYTDQLDIQIYEGIDQLPHFNPDLDQEPFPSAVIEFRELINQADGVLICTPEYVFSLPGALKNAIEWTVSTTVFSDKPVGLITAASSGEKAFESLGLIMTTIMAKVTPAAQLLIKAPKTKLNEQGNIKDKATLEKIDNLMQALLVTLINTQREQG